MFWFVRNASRLNREREALERLEAENGWLRGVAWGMASGKLNVDAIIRSHDHDYEVTMTYPEMFPAVPPAVKPKAGDERWSGHQWGTGGSLCLEWGPDNWYQEVTGAQMLESAHRLLAAENPLGEGPALDVASRHLLSSGQELRSKLLRFYVGSELSAYLARLPADASGTFEIRVGAQERSYTAVVRQLCPSGLTEWKDPSVPEALFGSGDELGVFTGVFFKAALNSSDIANTDTPRDLEEALAKSGREGVCLGEAGGTSTYPFGLEKRPRAVLLVDAEDRPHLYLLLVDDKVYPTAPVRSRARGPNPRLPAHMAEAATKTVGIVGLGSVGSKLAASLVRSGVRSFVLLDEDVLLPENLVRNDLDWREVGEHKVHAAKRRMELLAPGVAVDVYDLHLTGQESNASVAGALRRLGRCDLIVDATAEAGVFNLLAHVAEQYAKPLVWMKVFAGGIGGLIARSRPDFDPSPTVMRAAYREAIADSPEPAPPGGEPYTVGGEDGQPLTASDADVAVIAAQAAVLGLDTLLQPEQSVYPHSMYLLGLRPGWLFEQPLHNIPISTDELPHLPRENVDSLSDKDGASQGLKFLLEVLEEDSGARPVADGD